MTAGFLAFLMPVQDPIVDVWDERCRLSGDEILLVGSKDRASTADVDDLSRQVSSAALRRGLTERRVVALSAPNGPAFLAGLLGLRRVGCVVTLFDWQTPQQELLRASRALGGKALLRIREPWPKARGWQEWHPIDQEAAKEEPQASDDLPVLPPDVAFLKVTSGTTGTPQGVMVTASALVGDDAALTTTMELTARDRILAAIPMSHSYGLSSVAMPAIMRGCPLVVPEQGNPFGALQIATRHDVSFLPTVPAYLEGLVRASRPPAVSDSLRLVVSAGAPLRAKTAAAFRRLYGRSVHVFYGASECGGIAFDREGGAAERGVLGPPVEGVRIDLDPLPGEEGQGGRGVVRVTSKAVASGYFPVAGPRLGGGCFRTSDIGSWRDGELSLHGRIDSMIIVRGKNVDPLEVEELLRRNPMVQDVAVLGIPDISGAGQLVRAVVVAVGLDTEELRAWCRERVAEHKVPRSVVLVDELPRTGRGKLDRRALSALTFNDR